MNKLLPFLFAFASPLAFLQAQEPEQLLNTPIREVRVYLQGAEALHQCDVTLQPGKNKLIFKGLSPKIYDNTIQTVLPEGVRLLSVTGKINFLERREDSPRIRTLRDSVLLLRERIELLEAERDAYEKEKELLLHNQSIKSSSEGKNSWTEDLEKTADFFRRRILAVNKQLLQLERQWKEDNRRLFDFKLQLHELNAGQQPTSEVYLVVDAERGATVPVVLRYLMADAGWMPLYDLYAGEGMEQVELRYRGMAYNNTGTDWNEVKLSLSTADPMQSAVQPQLKVWDISNNAARFASSVTSSSTVTQQTSYQLNPFQDPKSYTQKTVTYTETVTALDINFVRNILGSDFRERIDYETDMYRRYQSEKQPRSTEIKFTTIELPELNAVFAINRPYTIPSDRKPYSIDISATRLNARYQYLAVPKIDKDAFLMVAVTGWEDLDLVSGPVNLYNRQRYLGQSFLDIRNISDTLVVSLGRDPALVVSRVKVAGTGKKQFLGSQNKTSVIYNITAKSHLSKNVVLEIQDQLPISIDKDITVSTDELSGATHFAESGLLSWKLNLEPGQEKNLSFGFSVKYPKEKNVTEALQYNRSNSRKLGCPSF